MNTSTLPPLIVNHAYHIRCESYNGFIGVGFLREINPPHYPADTYRFELIDDPDGITEGVFSRDEIGELAQRQDSVSDQMNDLLNVAVQLRMNDAADWLRANWRGFASP